jgi:hypothetical protein
MSSSASVSIARPSWTLARIAAIATLTIAFATGCEDVGLLGILPSIDLEPNAPAGAVRLVPDGDSYAGRIDQASDVDYYVFRAEAGQIYKIATTGDSDTYMALYAPDSSAALAVSNDSSEGTNASLSFRASTSGNLYVAVSLADFLAVGDYGVSVATVTDDIGDDAATATPLTPDAGLLNGRNSYSGDLDFFSFNAEAGETYLLETRGNADTWLVLYDTDGVTPLVTDDMSGFGYNGQILWIAPAAGTYYLAVGAYATSDYQVSIQKAAPLVLGAAPIAGSIGQAQEQDLFKVERSSDDTLQIEVTVEGAASVWLLNAAGGVAAQANAVSTTVTISDCGLEGNVFYLAITGSAPSTYHVAVVAGTCTDDHADETSEATPVAVNSTAVAGSLTLPDDADCFTFATEAGRTYVIETHGSTDTYLYLVWSDGTTILGEDDDGGDEPNARIQWQSLETGTAFVVVMGYDETVRGDYELSVETTD